MIILFSQLVFRRHHLFSEQRLIDKPEKSQPDKNYYREMFTIGKQPLQKINPCKYDQGTAKGVGKTDL